ncbi:MAG: ABC transporter permease [Acidimicrobiales bacterium]
MPIAAYLVRIELRRLRWSLVVLALVVAAVVGVVLASLAGATRAETAFDRYLAAYRSPDAAAFVPADDPAEVHARLQALADVDAVEQAVDFRLVGAFPASDTEAFYPFVVSEGGVVPFERMRAPVVEGRYPGREEPFEVALSERTARRLHVAVGDPLPLVTFSPDALEAFAQGEQVEPDGPPVSLDVVGIVRDPGDIGARESDITLTFLTPAFLEAVPPDEVGSVSDGAFVMVAPGHDLAEVTAALRGTDIELDTSFSANASDHQITPTLDAIATSTRVFALVAALAGLIAVGQAIGRLQMAASTDDRTLASLGASRRARWRRLFGPVAIATTAGAALGTLVAVVLSAFFPIGVAREADPDLGLHVDASLLAVGLLVSTLVLAGLTAGLATWRVRHAHGGGEITVSRWGRAIADLGAPPSAVTGLSLASGTPGRPGRIAVAGTLLSVLGVLAALVFSASVDRLAGDPALYGWGWDAVVEGADLTDLGEDAARSIGPALARDPDVEGATALFDQMPLTLGGAPFFATAVDEADATIRPVVVRGATPMARDEIAVGRDVLDEIDADVGDEVPMVFAGQERTARIAGVVVLPVNADGGTSALGVFLSPATDRAELDRACESSDSCTRTIAVALRDGADIEAFAARYQDDEQEVDVALPIPPGEIDRLTAVEDLPRYLAVFLAALAAVAISFATTTTIRQRRRDLAVLRVLGMTGRHVRSVVVVLVFALTAAGAVLGGVLGLVVGRQIWRAVATSVSLPFAPSIPPLAVILVPLGAVLFAQVVASTSRRAAGRIPAALVLRAE